MSRWIIRAVVSIGAGAILLAVIPVEALLTALRRITLGTWMASVAVFLAGHYLNALKLRLLLGKHRASATVCLQAQYAGLVANLGLPGLAGGDFVRAAYLVPTAGARAVTVASIADRVIDTLTIVLLVAIAAPIAGVPPVLRDVLWASGWWIGGAAIVGALLTLALVWWRRRVSATSLNVRVGDAWSTVIARPSALAGAALVSLLVQSAFVVTNVWFAREVGVTTGLAPWFVAWPLSKLVAILPISLGGIGVREAALVSLLVPYGAPADAVLASGIVWQTVLAASAVAGLIITQCLQAPATAVASPKSPGART
jgi:glycosyltransferase 2 family protein